jgi:putative membrane-bound dehydrogenase-like protein
MGARNVEPVNGGGDWVCSNPGHWIFEGTGIRKGESIPGLVGWAYHGSPATEIPGLEAVGGGQAGVARAVLAEGWGIYLAAAAPLVTHPTMACLDERGRLFVGDCVGVNVNKAQLEANPPNRVLMLEDKDGDGVFDRSTVFASGLTFPQCACWLDGALDVCSPSGLWRIQDRDGDGVGDHREILVEDFDYTGNAADVHGPFWNPAHQRLYWCHGRKGRRVASRDGVMVNEGLVSGIWSCKPDGSGLRWHALGCGDNPVEVDFAPEGDVVGVQNLYHSNPRGDTLVHFLLGGVYVPPDMLKAVEGLPRTRETMPVVHNFGHGAVSGCAFWRKNPWGPFQMLVTHFNTGRLVRMELTPSGSRYRATENEFVKVQDPDVHLTDVLADRDGSLLLLNTGGWFRIGCPSSLMAKPDGTGAIYRIASTTRGVRQGRNRSVQGRDPAPLPLAANQIAEFLRSEDMHLQRRACEWLAVHGVPSKPVAAALRKLLEQPMDAALEHAALYAAGVTRSIRITDLDGPSSPDHLRRILVVLDQFGGDSAAPKRTFEQALERLNDPDPDRARAALGIVARHPENAETTRKRLEAWMHAGNEEGLVPAGVFQAAMLLREAAPELVGRLGPVLTNAGPLELKALISMLGKTRDSGVARTLAEALAQKPLVGSQQESACRTALSAHPPEIFETVLLPALERASAQQEAKRFSLGPLSARLPAGDPGRGRAVFESGKGGCMGCHRIGTIGQRIGPVTGVIHGHSAEGLLIVDTAGQKVLIPHDKILSETTLSESLMPPGLDAALGEQDLVDLVSYLQRLH